MPTWCVRMVMVIPLLAWAAGTGSARGVAAEADAKATARESNCKPGKVEVIRQIPGGNGEILYKIICTDYPQMFMLIQCRQRLCILLR